MTIKTNVAIMLVVLTGVWLTSASEVLGQPRGRRAAHLKSSRATYNSSRRAAITAQPFYRSAFPPTYDYYPKYTGAFHARYFDELPSIYGPRPMRGTAW